jgi:hypothetical protein
MVDRRRPLGPCGQAVIAAAHEITCGAHPAGVDSGVGNEAAAPQRGDRVGVAAVVLGVAAMDGPPVERVAAHARHPLILAQVGEPGPR